MINVSRHNGVVGQRFQNFFIIVNSTYYVKFDYQQSQ